MEFNIITSEQKPVPTMESYHGYVRTTLDAIILLEACRIGVLPRVRRRLSEKERKAIRPGSVFVWDEREAGMRRWTDGKSWSASRVSGSFLTYREMEGKRVELVFDPATAADPSTDLDLQMETGSVSPEKPASQSPPSTNGQGNVSDDDGENGVQWSPQDGYRYKRDGLMKQSFSITTTTNLKLHLISYFSRTQMGIGGLLQVPSCDPALRHVVIPKGLYPDHSSPIDHPHPTTIVQIYPDDITRQQVEQGREVVPVHPHAMAPLHPMASGPPMVTAPMPSMAPQQVVYVTGPAVAVPPPVSALPPAQPVTAGPVARPTTPAMTAYSYSPYQHSSNVPSYVYHSPHMQQQAQQSPALPPLMTSYQPTSGAPQQTTFHQVHVSHQTAPPSSMPLPPVWAPAQLPTPPSSSVSVASYDAPMSRSPILTNKSPIFVSRSSSPHSAGANGMLPLPELTRKPVSPVSGGRDAPGLDKPMWSEDVRAIHVLDRSFNI